MDEGDDFVEVDGRRRRLRQLRKGVAMTLAEEIGHQGCWVSSRRRRRGANNSEVGVVEARLMFAFNNAILLGRVRARSLINNPILRRKKRETNYFSYISKALSVRSTRIEVENLVFISLKKSSITLETSDFSFSK